MEILLILATYLKPLIFTVLGILAMFAIRKAFDYFNINISDKLDGKIEEYVEKGIDVAEVAATKFLADHGAKMSSTSKKAKAVNVVMKELKKVGLLKVAEDVVEDRIEAALLGKGHKPGIAGEGVGVHEVADSDPTTGESA